MTAYIIAIIIVILLLAGFAFVSLRLLHTQKEIDEEETSPAEQPQPEESIEVEDILPNQPKRSLFGGLTGEQMVVPPDNS